MTRFDRTDTEPAYLRWLAGHPSGYVVNCSRPRPNPVSLVLHSASCRTIGPRASGGGRLTGRSYQKVCSGDLAELEAWARTEVGGELAPCGSCHPTGSRPTRVTPRQPQLTPVARPAPLSTAPLLEEPSPKRWRTGEILATVEGIRPLLASWDAKHHPSQQRLNAYLDELSHRLRPDDLPTSGLSLDLVVDVEHEGSLLTGRDLENYLTPVAKHLRGQRFVHARAVKRVGGGSIMHVRTAVEDEAPPSPPWMSVALDAGIGAGSKEGKMRLREGLRAAQVATLPYGPAAVDIALRCRPGRNWVELWKPVGDAMGPVLGEPNPRNPFDVADDRITELQLHRDVDGDIGHGVHVAFAWRMAE